jgi:hypothetical protein
MFATSSRFYYEIRRPCLLSHCSSLACRLARQSLSATHVPRVDINMWIDAGYMDLGWVPDLTCFETISGCPLAAERYDRLSAITST